MKIAAAIIISLVLVGYGSTHDGGPGAPVAAAPAVETVPSANLLAGLLAGVRALLTAALAFLFNAINNLLVLIFKSLLFLLTLFLPAKTVFQLAAVKDKTHFPLNYYKINE